MYVFVCVVGGGGERRGESLTLLDILPLHIQLFEPAHYKKKCIYHKASSKSSDDPVQRGSLIKAFAVPLRKVLIEVDEGSDQQLALKGPPIICSKRQFQILPLNKA